MPYYVLARYTNCAHFVVDSTLSFKDGDNGEAKIDMDVIERICAIFILLRAHFISIRILILLKNLSKLSKKSPQRRNC